MFSLNDNDLYDTYNFRFIANCCKCSSYSFKNNSSYTEAYNMDIQKNF